VLCINTSNQYLTALTGATPVVAHACVGLRENIQAVTKPV